MRRELLDILVCPVCKGQLDLTVAEESAGEIVTGSLRCTGCGETYVIEDSLPNMLPPDQRS